MRKAFKTLLPSTPPHEKSYPNTRYHHRDTLSYELHSSFFSFFSYNSTFYRFVYGWRNVVYRIIIRVNCVGNDPRKRRAIKNERFHTRPFSRFKIEFVDFFCCYYLIYKLYVYICIISKVNNTAAAAGGIDDGKKIRRSKYIYRERLFIIRINAIRPTTM